MQKLEHVYWNPRLIGVVLLPIKTTTRAEWVTTQLQLSYTQSVPAAQLWFSEGAQVRFGVIVETPVRHKNWVSANQNACSELSASKNHYALKCIFLTRSLSSPSSYCKWLQQLLISPSEEKKRKKQVQGPLIFKTCGGNQASMLGVLPVIVVLFLDSEEKRGVFCHEKNKKKNKVCGKRIRGRTSELHWQRHKQDGGGEHKMNVADPVV